MDYDFVVVGAGPVGGLLAKRLCDGGATVLILEEHAQIGRPFQCAGLVNPEAMEIVELHDTVLTSIWGARIHGPSGEVVSIGSPETVRTWSVCRKMFDESIVEEALKSGADLWLSSNPISAEQDEYGVNITISTPDGNVDVRCSMLCGADGAHSWVRRNFRMGRPKEMMIGFQIEVTGYVGEEGRLDMYTGSEIAPGFFAWAIPSGDTTRIGTWSKADMLQGKSPEQLLDTLMKSPLWTRRFSRCREVGRFCGPVPSGLVKRPLKGRVTLFGDAAGLCKPTTGGGIGPGFTHVEALAPLLLQRSMGNLTQSALDARVSRVLEPIRKDQLRAKALRDAFLTQMDDVELDDVFSVWSKPEVIELINEVGEIENPIPLGMRMLREVPEFRSLARRAVKAVLWG
ncbi:MAG: geranylgeranyl reductase family protein [Candidatus Thermoplasmatota archaeon]|nr:geranylgeranyl reductase family protein [Candidatus Thermoplasmatota archaeon]